MGLNTAAGRGWRWLGSSSSSYPAIGCARKVYLSSSAIPVRPSPCLGCDFLWTPPRSSLPIYIRPSVRPSVCLSVFLRTMDGRWTRLQGIHLPSPSNSSLLLENGLFFGGVGSAGCSNVAYWLDPQNDGRITALNPLPPTGPVVPGLPPADMSSPRKSAAALQALAATTTVSTSPATSTDSAMARNQDQPVIVPRPRCGACGVAVGASEGYIFGGYEAATHSHFDDFFHFRMDPTEGTIRWTSMQSPPGIPPSWGATLSRVKDRLFLFGGEDAKCRALSSLSVFSLSESKWIATRVIVPVPEARYLHSASVCLDDKIFILGGLCASQGGHPLWMFDSPSMRFLKLELGSKIKDRSSTSSNANGNADGVMSAFPAAFRSSVTSDYLAGHTASSIDGDLIFIYGGLTSQGAISSAAQLLDVRCREFVEIRTHGGQSDAPPPLWKHSAMVRGDSELVVVNGVGPSGRHCGAHVLRVDDF